MSYKRLGDYIQQVNVRNKDLETNILLGVSITKKLIPSIANIIGTDMSVYKIIEKRQFAYGTVTSRNGEKISIALSDRYEKALVSQIYIVFEVIEEQELLPEYLMMWFSRPEFDRYVRYHSHGSTRETFDWADMCAVELPIPPIEEQKQFVAQYHSVVNKIKVNEQICSTLEATAQALYKHWFVDFEFPDRYCEEQGTSDEAIPSLGYKSSGGKMVWNEELGKEIPEGWEVGELGEIVSLSQGIQVEVENQYLEKENRNRFLRIIDYTVNADELPRYVDIFDERYFATKDDIVVIRYGDAGTICRRLEGIIANNLFKVTPISTAYNKNYVFYFLKDPITQQQIKCSSGSSTMPAISHSDIKKIKLIYCTGSALYELFNECVDKIEKNIILKNEENQKLTQLQALMLSRLVVGEEVGA